MPPKAAEKKPSTGGKAPAGKAPAEKKEAGKKTAAPSGDKKKRNKTRKETYSSYIYKGKIRVLISQFHRVGSLFFTPLVFCVSIAPFLSLFPNVAPFSNVMLTRLYQC